MSGFVVIRREALDHHLLRDAERFRAWCWLIASACWKPTKFDVHGKTITLERGQLCVSVRQLAEAWGWSKSAADRFIQRLVDEDMVISTRAQTGTGSGTTSGTARSIITICNYSKYQDVPSAGGTKSEPPSGTAAGQQRDIKEPSNQDIPLSNDNGPADFWQFAVGYLGEKRRPLIGRWCGAYGQPATAQAITAAQLARAVDPPAYIERTLKGARDETRPLVPL
jgi:hypothetical protein